MRHDAQFDLGIVRTRNHPARRRHKSFAHAAAFRRTDGDVLQVRVVAAQPTGHGHGLGIVGVHPACARVGQLGKFVGVGAFEFGQPAVLQQFGGQWVVFGQFFEHFFVGAACAGSGFLDHGHTQFVEENFTQLLGAAQVKRLACDLVRFRFQLQDALAQFMALRSQCGRVDQHAIPLDTVQRLARRDFQFVDTTQFGVCLQLGPQHTVHVQRLVRIFTRIVRGFANFDLAERNLVRTFATQVFVIYAAAPQVALGQAGQAVGLVHLQHITLQHGVVHITLHLDAVVGKHMAVVFDVLAELFLLPIHQPGREARQHFVAWQLGRSVRVIVGQRNVGTCAGLDAETDAHDLGHHLVERGGLGVQRHQVSRVDTGEPGIKSVPGQHGVVLQGGGGLDPCGLVGQQVFRVIKQAWLVAGRPGGFGGGWGCSFSRCSGVERAGQPLEAKFIVKTL